MPYGINPQTGKVEWRINGHNYLYLPGRAGGQTAYFDTASGGNGYLYASSHATRGNLYLNSATYNVNSLGDMKMRSLGLGTADSDPINYALYIKNAITAGLKFEAGTGYALLFVARNAVDIGYFGLGSLSANTMSLATYTGNAAPIQLVPGSVVAFYAGAEDNPHIYSQYTNSARLYSIGLNPATATPSAKFHLIDGRDGSTTRDAQIIENTLPWGAGSNFLKCIGYGGGTKAYVNYLGGGWFRDKTGIRLNDGVGAQQALDVSGHFRFSNIVSPTNTIAAALAGVAGNVDNGEHRYKVTYFSADGETQLSGAYTSVTVTDKTTNGQVSLTSIPISTDFKTTRRKIYRTKAGSTVSYYLLATITDNTTTTYTDNTADSGLGTADARGLDNTTSGRFYKDGVLIGYLGQNNLSFGYLALSQSTSGLTGYYNFAMGNSASRLLTGGSDQNTVIGNFALENATTCDGVTAIGYSSFNANLTSSGGTAYGVLTGSLATNIVGSTLIGYYVMTYATNVSGVTAVGGYAGTLPAGVAANQSLTSTNCTFLGYQTGLASTTQRTKSIAIGYRAVVDADNTCVIGGTGADAVSVAIGGTTASEKLHIYGGNAFMEDNYGAILGTGKDMKMFYNGTDGYLQTDLVAPSDLHVDCGTDKTVVLDESVWDDLRVVPGSFDRPGSSDPSIQTYDVNGGGVNTYLWGFAKNNIASFSVQLPHNYKQGTDIYCHVHWTPGANGAANNGLTVGWKVDYSWANIGSNFGTMATLDLSDACDGVDHKHQMASDVVISGTGKNISSMLICNIKRTDTGTDDTWTTGTPMILEIDFHYEIDTMGSRTTTSK